MMRFVADMMWGTFNYRNKGIPLYKWPRIGWDFALIQKSNRKLGVKIK